MERQIEQRPFEIDGKIDREEGWCKQERVRCFFLSNVLHVISSLFGHTVTDYKRYEEVMKVSEGSNCNIEKRSDYFVYN